jgi:hypothetical protein
VPFIEEHTGAVEGLITSEGAIILEPAGPVALFICWGKFAREAAVPLGAGDGVVVGEGTAWSLADCLCPEPFSPFSLPLPLELEPEAEGTS